MDGSWVKPAAINCLLLLLSAAVSSYGTIELTVGVKKLSNCPKEPALPYDLIACGTCFILLAIPLGLSQIVCLKRQLLHLVSHPVEATRQPQRMNDNEDVNWLDCINPKLLYRKAFLSDDIMAWLVMQKRRQDVELINEKPNNDFSLLHSIREVADNVLKFYQMPSGSTSQFWLSRQRILCLILIPISFAYSIIAYSRLQSFESSDPDQCNATLVGMVRLGLYIRAAIAAAAIITCTIATSINLCCSC